MQTLKANYERNVLILRENLKRGLEPSKAINVIESWRSAFIKNNLYGEDEKAFINSALAEVESYTHITVREV